jgi:hypothetical protein
MPTLSEQLAARASAWLGRATQLETRAYEEQGNYGQTGDNNLDEPWSRKAQELRGYAAEWRRRAEMAERGKLLMIEREIATGEDARFELAEAALIQAASAEGRVFRERES